MSEQEIIESPDCLFGHQHKVWQIKGTALVYECEFCFERFYMISETTAKEAGLKLVPKKEKGK